MCKQKGESMAILKLWTRVVWACLHCKNSQVEMAVPNSRGLTHSWSRLTRELVKQLNISLDLYVSLTHFRAIFKQIPGQVDLAGSGPVRRGTRSVLTQELFQFYL